MDFGIFIPDFVRRAFFIGVSRMAHPSSIVHCSITYRRVADGSTGNVTTGQARPAFCLTQFRTENRCALFLELLRCGIAQ
jgi:hypothetical protein